eukprot:SAG22_NODE_2333_length_2707_cov_1.282209_2_plen_20_part_01
MCPPVMNVDGGSRSARSYSR